MNHMLLNILLSLPQDINLLLLLILFKHITLRHTGMLCSDKLIMPLLGKLSAENYRNGDLRESPEAFETCPAFIFNRELLKFPHRLKQGKTPTRNSSQDCNRNHTESDESYIHNFACH